MSRFARLRRIGGASAGPASRPAQQRPGPAARPAAEIRRRYWARRAASLNPIDALRLQVVLVPACMAVLAMLWPRLARAP